MTQPMESEISEPCPMRACFLLIMDLIFIVMPLPGTVVVPVAPGILGFGVRGPDASSAARDYPNH